MCAVQGLWLRRKARRLPGAAGARSGVCGEGPAAPLRLLAIGDSIIDGVGAGSMPDSLPVQFARRLSERRGRPVHWWVDGESGRDLAALLERIEHPALPGNLDRVLVSIGVNDVTGLSSTRRWGRGLEALLRGVWDRWPSATLLFAGLPPMQRFPLPPQPLRFALGLRASTLDRIAAEVMDRPPKALHVPTRIDPARHAFCADGFHPAADSCRLWAEELADIDAGRIAP